jgi:hypothetical protein
VFRAISPASFESMKLLFPLGNLSESRNETIPNRNTYFVTGMSESGAEKEKPKRRKKEKCAGSTAYVTIKYLFANKTTTFGG